MYEIKDIPNYPGYRVDTLGEVWTCWKHKITEHAAKGYIKKCARVQSNEWKQMKTNICKWGYKSVELWKNGKNKRIKNSRLLALAFIPNPENKRCVNHKNGIKTDDRLENLEWVTAAENTQHAYDTGLAKGRKGEESSTAKLQEWQVKWIKLQKQVEPTIKHKELAKMFKVSRSLIGMILANKRWQHIII